MLNRDTDAAAVRLPPPLVYLAFVIAGLLLHAFATPLRLPLATGVRIALSLVVGAGGLALIGSAFGRFKQTGQDPKPWKTTPQVIATGIYRFTRNPMYLGMALLQAAVGIALGNGWVLALIPASLVGVYLAAIRHEETYLEGKFGDAYRAYKASVRRWI